MENNKRKKFIFANKLHRRIMLIVFLSAIVPTIITGGCLYYLIFNITARQIGFPEAIFTILMPALRQVNIILLFVLPISITLIWFWAMVISHRMVGPLDRLTREIDDRITGTKTGRIRVRAKDAMSELSNKINLLLDKTKK